MTDLTPEQIARIEYLATDEWVVDDGGPDDDAQSWLNFTRCLNEMSSIELHHFACNFNWDCGVKELNAMIDHRECDAGTALMIYWSGQPAEYYRAESRGHLTPDDSEVVELLRKIENKLVGKEFTKNNIACDPLNMMGQPKNRGSDQEREIVPDQMFQKLDGIEIEPHWC